MANRRSGGKFVQRTRPPAEDKVRTPAEDKAQLGDQVAKVRAAQQLLDTETADSIIGERSAEYDALIQAANAAMAMNWAAMKSCGARQNPTSLQFAAQSQVIVLDLLHKAYALGIRRGAKHALDLEAEGGAIR